MLCLFLVNKIQSNDTGDWPPVSKDTPQKIKSAMKYNYKIKNV